MSESTSRPAAVSLPDTRRDELLSKAGCLTHFYSSHSPELNGYIVSPEKFDELIDLVEQEYGVGKEKPGEVSFVPLPLSILQSLADLELEDRHDDNGPGWVTCPTCEASMQMRWRHGQRLDSQTEFQHLETCAAEWARKTLEALE